MAIKISGVIITLNEEKLIARAIGSMKPWVQEIIVLDGGSTDKTVQIASDLGAFVYFRDMGDVQAERDFGAQKSLAVSLASYPWVFLLDADETCEEALWKSLQGLALNKEGCDIVGFPRKNTYSDKPEPEPGLELVRWPDHQHRFFRNYVRYTGKLHESPTGWRKEARYDGGAIIHHKTWERQHMEDDLYFAIRPQDYPERLREEEALLAEKTG